MLQEDKIIHISTSFSGIACFLLLLQFLTLLFFFRLVFVSFAVDINWIARFCTYKFHFFSLLFTYFFLSLTFPFCLPYFFFLTFISFCINLFLITFFCSIFISAKFWLCKVEKLINSYRSGWLLEVLHRASTTIQLRQVWFFSIKRMA